MQDVDVRQPDGDVFQFRQLSFNVFGDQMDAASFFWESECLLQPRVALSPFSSHRWDGSQEKEEEEEEEDGNIDLSQCFWNAFFISSNVQRCNPLSIESKNAFQAHQKRS